MNGLDCLREEMEKRGLNKTQQESKTAAVVLDILANSGDHYTELWKEEQEATTKLDGLIWRLEHLSNEERRLEDLLGNHNERIKETEIYVKNFFDRLNNCETDEDKTRLKAAQIFINTVKIDTKYDNTAFIIGLAQILSGGNFDGIDALKAINPDLFTEKPKKRRIV